MTTKCPKHTTGGGPCYCAMPATACTPSGNDESTWTTEKPTQPGAYRVRGFDIGDASRTALVEVKYDGGILCCNLHEKNSEGDMRRWYSVFALSARFEWSGPLMPCAGG